MRRRVAVALPTVLTVLTVLTVGGCSLPLPGGVRSASGVPAEQRPQDDIVVIPPGPRPGQAPIDVVGGFLAAQASAQDGHAVARRFLARASDWDERGDVLVYDPGSLRVTSTRQDGRTAEVQTTVLVSAAVRGDGSYVALPPRQVVDAYRLARIPGGQWRLTTAPGGLRLTAADRDRSFAAVRTYFLAPAVAGEAPHLVADPVFLPDAVDLARSADTLVRRLVAGPSRSLAGSVQTAVPVAARVERVRADGAGLVEVSLTGPAAGLSAAQRQELSAQLVWTLRSLKGFSGLRLLVGGSVLSLPGTGTSVQDASSWESYDPDGLAPDPPVYYVDGRRLRAVDTVLPAGPATAGEPGKGQAVALDAVAVTPDRTQVALLAGRTLRIGPLKSASYPIVLRRSGLRSPTWGAGGSGVWLLDGGSQVLRVVGRDVQQVPLEGSPDGLTSIALSRDGVRLALAAHGRLLVGRVDRTTSRLRVVDLTDVAPALTAVTRVAWAGATSLVAIGSLQGTVLPVRIGVDGASLVPLDGPGLPGPALQITASPAGTVVTAAGPGGSRLYRASGSGFRVLPGKGTAPAYPG